jgi:leucine dehydrogenase
MPSPFELLRELGHEELVVCQDREGGLTAVVAIHDTSLGPAVGGTRMRLYSSLDEAIVDALRLSRAMTYKAALAGIARGGGKAVILGDPARDKSRALLQAYAELVNRLGGRFHTGGDMGIDGRDVGVLARMTKHASHSVPGSPVETADLAALGVFEAIRAAARELDRPLASLHVAVQGLGQLGYRLCRRLADAGVRLTVADVDESRVLRAERELGAASVAPDGIHDVEADVFSPNAAGGILNDETLPRLRCAAVIGGANEQLLEPRHGDALEERGILYGPDYVVNAGGLISLLYEIGETDEDGVVELVRAIGPRCADIWSRARGEGVAPQRVADRLAEERIAAAREGRK